MESTRRRWPPAVVARRARTRQRHALDEWIVAAETVRACLSSIQGDSGGRFAGAPLLLLLLCQEIDGEGCPGRGGAAGGGARCGGRGGA